MASGAAVSITAGGRPVAGRDLARVRSVVVEESLGGRTEVAVVVSLDPGARSAWTSPLDALVAPAQPLGVELRRGAAVLAVDARTVAASWSVVPGGESTLTVEAADRSVLMDLHQRQRTWQGTTDAAVASTLFEEHHLAADVEQTPAGADPATYSPQQDSTDWELLTALASRNGFDVRVETAGGRPTGVFRRVDPTAPPQASLALGAGEDGGAASASVQLLHGEAVEVVRVVPGTSSEDVHRDDGTGSAMGERSLGGVGSRRTGAASGLTAQDARTTARAIAERSAFGAQLSFALARPDSPLLRARRTVDVRGLGEALDGRWLVRSVRHVVTPGGHVQSVSLLRNALGPAPAGLGVGGGLASALTSGLGGALAGAGALL